MALGSTSVCLPWKMTVTFSLSSYSCFALMQSIFHTARRSFGCLLAQSFETLITACHSSAQSLQMIFTSLWGKPVVFPATSVLSSLELLSLLCSWSILRSLTLSFNFCALYIYLSGFYCCFHCRILYVQWILEYCEYREFQGWSPKRWFPLLLPSFCPQTLPSLLSLHISFFCLS